MSQRLRPDLRLTRLTMHLPSLPLPRLRLRPLPPSLALAHALPLRIASWMSATTGPLRRLKVPISVWAQLRGDVLMLCPENYLRDVKKGQQVKTMHGNDLEKVVQAAPKGKVMVFVLPATKIIIREEEGEIELRGLAGKPGVVLKVADVSKWKKAMFEALTERVKNLSDFQILRQIGKGASGRVYLVEDLETKEKLALKVIEKKTVYESDDAYRHALDERLVLQLAGQHPYILKLRYAFQNSKRLFLITEYCAGGDLFDCMDKRAMPLDEKVAKIVAAQVLLALQHIHSFGVVYRDLKLENILLDVNGHVRIADFGLSKVLKSTDGRLKRTDTFCGTREYVAPEMIRGDMYDTSLDIWAFGILLYEMLSGRTPFYSPQHNQIYKRIEKAPIFYPHYLSPEVRSLIEKLLKRDPIQRLGVGKDGLDAIKAHKWFEGVNWDKLAKGKKKYSPLRSYIQARERLATNGTTMSRSKEKKEYHERAMTELVADLKEDLRYVTASANSPASALAKRPISPMAKRVRSILAGYTFCDNNNPKPSKGQSESMREVRLESLRTSGRVHV